MNRAVPIAELASSAAAIVKQAEAEGVVPLARGGRTVAFLVSREKLAALIESVELEKNKELMRLVRADRARRLVFTDVE